MTIISAMRDYIAGCPLLSGGTLHVDFLEPEWGDYSLDNAVTETVVKTYMDGSSRRQQDFNLVSRCPYGGEILQQMNNIGFFESVQAWIEHQMLNRNYPDLGETEYGQRRKCVSVSATSCGYPVGEDETSAYYQIGLRLTYLQEGL